MQHSAATNTAKRARDVDDSTDSSDSTPAADTKKMPPYKSKVRVLEKYKIIGFISSGTYGRVYKARSRTPGNTKEFAIKK